MKEPESVYHVPVMAGEIVQNLIIEKQGLYLDGTLGGGGHAEYLLKHLGENAKLIGLDRDPEALLHCREKFSREPRMEIHHRTFSEINAVCAPGSLSGVLLDLGVSSHQLDSRERGFSFEKDGPLDMRMNAGTGQTALDYLEQVSEDDLAGALRHNADLERSRHLAREIKLHVQTHRNSNAIREAVSRVFPGQALKKPKIYARVFQAVRMEINDEVRQIREGLKCAVSCLKPGGRICVLTYHSVEDRTVKQMIAAAERKCICPQTSPVCVCGDNHQSLKRVHRKPLLPAIAETAGNRRARSAKLRVAERTGA